MRAETVALPFQVGDAAAALAVFHAVVVQPGFTDGDDFGMLGQRTQGHEVGWQGVQAGLIGDIGWHPALRQARQVLPGDLNQPAVPWLHGRDPTQRFSAT